MSRPLDVCPTCGKQSLIAVCTVVAEYAIANEGECEQDWSRREVDDDTSEPTLFRCDSCGVEFRRFSLDGSGYLVGLGPVPGEAATPALAMTAEGFQEWLNATVADWCRSEGLTPNGESEDLGDLYRHLEENDSFTAVGVMLIPAYEDQTLYIVGPQSSWLATTGIELGIESESIWQDPLANLRLDVPMDDLVSYGERVRRRADEIAALLSGHERPGYIAHWAFTNADNDVVLFSKTYDHEPTDAAVRKDGHLWHEEEGEGVDEAAFEAWHDRLCQPGLVSIVPLG